jgi:hypothetical protein
VALKSGQEGTSNKDIEEMLDALDQTLDRLKTLYEQYFLGIQKQAPAFIHNDVERKLRDLTQMNLRNTSLRYRLATLQQKFGSYNSYWRRTLRQIENGTYARNLAKIGREAAKKGADIPEEILAAMPKRMREQVLRDRDAAIAIAKRRNQIDEPAAPQYDDDTDEPAAIISDAPRGDIKLQSGAHVLSEDDGDLDFEKLFSAFEDDAPKTTPAKPAASVTQQMTRPIARPAPQVNEDTDPGFAFDLDAAQRDAQPSRPTSAIPRPVGTTPSQSTAIPKPVTPTPSGTTALPRQGQPASQHPVARQTGPVPIPAVNTPTSAIPKPMAPSQASRPNPIAPGAALRTGPVAVESMSGPFPRAQTPDPSTTPSSSHAPTDDPSTAPFGAPPARPTTTMPSRPTPMPTSTRPTPPSTPTPTRPTPPVVPRPAPPNAPTQAMPKVAPPNAPTQAMPKVAPPTAPTQAMPRTGSPNAPAAPTGSTQAMPRTASPNAANAPTQAMPKPSATQPVARPTPNVPRPPARPPQKPPPGMTDADVNALHAKYIQAKQMVGEKVDPGSREKLLRTINQTAPKIMQQYKASGVDFSVVVKDNQVVIKAKPKT